ncbi:lipopolysaccharide biosynthesis protein [Carboxylicivirga caseinilyticus]|uniref:lipopolysaccharide biosynthesis protein n=1 Tax=Carboxylicivirga caseinilyticus TaxID=3417572 RepID=UPI003D326275|nr:oligosaccharide flippase family protein [Marinilabiliaceae bacterium A049]
MSKLKSLAGETIIYGASTIISRLLAWLLMPFYIRTLDPELFGGVTNIYSYIAVVLVLLTFGLETGYFRFVSEDNKDDLLKSLTTFISGISILFVLVVFVLIDPITNLIGNEFLIGSIFKYGAIIVSIDAIVSLPFADLRYRNLKLKYASLRLIQVLLNIILNVFFLVILPYLANNDVRWADILFDPNNRLKYVFIANILSSGLIGVYFIPLIFTNSGKLVFHSLQPILKYSTPIMIVGLFGMLIQNADKILMLQLVPENAMKALGIYSANYKIGVLMMLFIQSYRLAFEPFFFKEGKQNTSKDLYARILKYFVIFGIIIYVGVLLFLDVVNLFLLPEYYEGNIIIPFVLLGQLFFGIYYSLSLWYKLTDKTKYGAYISGFGAFTVIILNIVLVPKFGYLGAAISSFICFFLMMILSYFYGQKFYPINYPVKTIVLYILSGIVIVYLASLITLNNNIFLLVIKGFIFVSYIGTILLLELKNFKKILR